MEIDQGENTLFIARFCVVKMQISWYKSDRSCGKNRTDSWKGSKLDNAPRKRHPWNAEPDTRHLLASHTCHLLAGPIRSFSKSERVMFALNPKAQTRLSEAALASAHRYVGYTHTHILIYIYIYVYIYIYISHAHLDLSFSLLHTHWSFFLSHTHTLISFTHT